MYNLSSMLESILDELDIKKCNDLEAVKHYASDMISLHSDNAWKKTNKFGSMGGRLDSIHEEDETRGRRKGAHGSKPKDENNLGVFDSDNIRAALSQMNYKVAYVMICCL